MDGFDRLPDSLILQIFNSVFDVKTLIRCRSISKRFNYLVPQTDSLLLRVDRVISPESDSLLLFLINLLLKPIFKAQVQVHPAQILSSFSNIRHLTIELPADDLRFFDGKRNGVVKWVAEFGESLKSCVVFGFSRATEPDDVNDPCTDSAGGLKERVLWTISALMVASARYCMLREVVKKCKHMERVVLRDKDGKGTVVMNKEGLTECREAVAAEKEAEEGVGGESGDWLLVNGGGVRIRLRMLNRIRLKKDGGGGGGGSSGGWAVGATLVVVRPSWVKNEVEDEVDLAMKALGCGDDGEVVRALLKSQCYQLQMSSL